MSVVATRTLVAALATALLLSGCGGGSSGGGGGNDGGDNGGGGPDLGLPNSLELIDLGDVPFTETISVFGGRFAATRVLDAQIASDTVGFTILTDLSSTGRFGVIGRVTDPTGRDLTPGSSLDEFVEGPLKPGVDSGAVSLVIPKSPQTLPVAGTYRFRIIKEASATGSVPVRLAIRRGNATGRRVPLNIMLHRFAGLEPADLTPAINRMRAIYRQVGIDLDPVEVFVAGNVLNATVTDLGPGSDVERVFNIQGPLENAVTAYLLVDIRLEGTDGTLLGIAGGIPGSHAWPRPTDNGVLISVPAHRDAQGELIDDFIATTIAHEIGHWLGLNHTTESTGDSFDRIQDTPECPISRDINEDGTVGSFECPDGPNLMFWTGFTNDDLSPDQGVVLRRTPLAVP